MNWLFGLVIACCAASNAFAQSAGGPLRVATRIVKPAGATGTLPAVLYMHGGGWVLGNAATHDRLVREAEAAPGVIAGSLAKVSIPTEGSGNDSESQDALASIRDDAIPAAFGGIEGVTVAVSGNAAQSVDFRDQLIDRLPLIFGFVFALAFLLMLVTFRSIVIPIKAILLNLLSVGAAYGILTLVFQEGHGEQALGFHSVGGIVPWLPLFLFVILFGLSMDYHVFVISRIRESFNRSGSMDAAISEGIRSTAGVVTSAAIVMVGVFAIFATLSIMMFKQFGVGLAAAILIDATIVRGVLLPATMKLLGERNWYLPAWLEWLPRLEDDEDAAPETAATPVSV